MQNKGSSFSFKPEKSRFRILRQHCQKGGIDEEEGIIK